MISRLRAQNTHLLAVLGAEQQIRWKVLSSRTRRSGSRATALLRLAAVTVGRTDTALAHQAALGAHRQGQGGDGHATQSVYNAVRMEWSMSTRRASMRHAPCAVSKSHGAREQGEGILGSREMPYIRCICR